MPERERIWIIGASSGIGAALARHYAAAGAEVIVSARNAAGLADLAAATGARALPLDVGRRETLAAAAARVGAPLDRIVHLAALYDPGRIADLDPARAAELVTVNLLGSFHVAQLAPPLLRPGGQLALCGSVAAWLGLPKGQIYSATKAGVASLAQSLRAERPDLDIRLISPGFVETGLTRKNDFAMPALLQPADAARAIAAGLAGRGFEIHFPKRFTWPMKLLAALPYGLSLRLTRRLAP